MVKFTLFLITILTMSLIYSVGDEDLPSDLENFYFGWIAFLSLVILSRCYFGFKNYIFKIPDVPVMSNSSPSSWIAKLFGYSHGYNINNPREMMNMFEEKGPLVQCSHYGHHLLMISDPVTTKDILQNVHGKCTGSVPNSSSNIFKLEGEEWQKRRNALKRPFDHSAMNMNSVSVSIAKHVNSLCEELITCVDGDVVPLDFLFSELSLNVLLKFAFGINSLEDLGYPSKEMRDEVANDLKIVFESIGNRFASSTYLIQTLSFAPQFIFAALSPILFFFPKTKTEILSNRRLRVLADKILQRMLVTDAIGEGATPGSMSFAFVQKLYELPTIGYYHMLNEICAILLGGYQTTAHALSFFFYSLTFYDGGHGMDVCRDAMVRLHNEIYEEDGQSTSPQESVAEEVATYLKANSTLPNIIEACLKESMRVFPVTANGLFREIKTHGGYSAQTSSGTNILIPEHTCVLLHTYTLHHNSTSWDSPSTWMPDRWLANDIKSVSSDAKQEIHQSALDDMVSAKAYTGCGTRRNEISYLPFGSGPRSCLGMNLALLEIRMAIATILLSGISFELADEIHSSPSKCATTAFALKPVRDLPVYVRKRSL